MNGLKLIVGAFGICLLGVAGLSAQEGKSDNTPAVEANAFFRAWFLDRDPRHAMTYFSRQATLGLCMTPESLEKKEPLSRKEIYKVFRGVLDAMISQIPRKKSLDRLITARGTDVFSSKDIVAVDHQFERDFRLFTLIPTKDHDLAFVCKSDDRKAFREQVNRPDVYYLATRLVLRDSPSPIITVLWVREERTWRILTMEISSDED